MSETSFRIPRKSELVRLSPAGGKLDIKPFIEDALDDDAVIERIEGYKTNGGITGDHKLDDVRTMDCILAWDQRHGDRIRGAQLREADVLAQVNVVLRRRFVLDKKRKIVGLNEKRYQLLTHQS
jgi:hypothetical protein